ncbi:MAG: hypothetical protein HYV29_13345 [Ignavibacteriales bacterium]|nr:hypothetical protein [Ignavibacteriales bacterium]
MVDQKIENETLESSHSVENALAMLWEKAREASYLISTLRDEKKKLQSKIEEVEEELMHAKNELQTKQSQLDQVQKELSNGSAHSSIALAGDEKKVVQQKIRSVISKLEQYLSS